MRICIAHRRKHTSNANALMLPARRQWSLQASPSARH